MYLSLFEVLCWFLVCITLCPFYFCNHLDEEERAVCFSLVFSWCLVTVTVMWLFLTMPWIGLRCVIAAFPDHTHFFIT